MNEKVHPNPADYWRIASEALEVEQRKRLRAMKSGDGLLALNRLAQGSQLRRLSGIDREVELVLIAKLFRGAYEMPRARTS
jgi:hypothetical protein